MKFNNYNLITILFFIFSYSCKNNLTEVEYLLKDKKSPDISSEGVVYTYSEEGTIVLRIEAPKVDNFQSTSKYIEFPEGIKVTSYNLSGTKESLWSADYAIKHSESGITEAKGNIILENFKNEKLETDFLVWDQKKEKIYTDKFVRIIQTNDTITGQGFQSNINFSEYKILNTKGEISIYNK